MNIINRKLGLKLNYFFVLLFIYLPIALMIVLSFNESKYFNQWTGFTFKWYQQLFENQNLISAFNNSVIVAISSTILSLVFGFGIALFMFRVKTKFSKTIEKFIYVPIVIPDVTMAAMMLVFFVFLSNYIDLKLGILTTIISHTAFNISFVAVLISSKFTRKLKVLEEAASDLYANNIQVIKHITLPFVMPALLASVILSFILSFDEVVISMFVTGPGSTTLPVYVFSMIKKGVTPVVNSISSLMLIFSLILVSSVLVLSGKDDFK
jgi:spermidine/putrescine transport system permease protein